MRDWGEKETKTEKSVGKKRSKILEERGFYYLAWEM